MFGGLESTDILALISSMVILSFKYLTQHGYTLSIMIGINIDLNQC